MGIPLGGGNFTRGAAIPLDDSFVAADTTVRDAINAGIRYEGMLVYVIADMKMYQLQGGITNSDWVVTGGGGAAVTYVKTFSGNGGTLNFPLAANPVSIENTQVYVHGVYQQKNVDYVLNTPDIDFVVAPPVGTDNIEVVYATPTTPLVIPDGYIDTVKLADGAVTTAKILDANVTNAKIVSMDSAKLTGDVSSIINSLVGDNTLDGAKLLDNSIPASKYEDFSITTGKVDDNAITEAKMNRNAPVFSSTFTGAFTSTSFSTTGSLSFTKGTINQNKWLKIELVPSVATNPAYLTCTDGEVQLLRGATVIGIHRISDSGVTERPANFTWFDQSSASAAQTYTVQIKTLTGVTTISFTNVKMAITYL